MSWDRGHRPRRVAPSWVRSQWLQAAVIFALAALVLVWQPLISDGFLGPGDITQSTPLLRSTPAERRVENPAQIDVAVDMLPWLAWDRHEVQDGRLPTWNPYNGSGVPHLANGQSAVFSVFTVPFYVLTVRLALIVSAFAVIVVASLLMYGLLRHLRLSHLAGIVGGLGFGLSAFMVMWLRWPMASAGAFIPGIVWAAGALAFAPDLRRRAAAFAGLAACFALSLFAGHPETTAFGAGVAAVVVVARVLAARPPAADAVRRIGLVAGGFVLGAALAAVQVLPLLEYVRDSPASENRGGHQLFVDGKYLALQAFPFVLGSPAHEYDNVTTRAQVPYLEVANLYVGLGVLFLAGIGLVSMRWTGRRTPLIFGALALLWVPYGYDIFGIGDAVANIPGLELLVAVRSGVLWVLCVTVLAAFGVDGLRELAHAPARSERAPRLVALGAVVLLVVAWILQRGLRRTIDGHDDPDLADLAARTARDHLIYVVATFVVVVAGALLLVRPPGGSATGARLTRVGAGLLVLGVFVQSGFLLRDFNPTVEGDVYYARTGAFDQIEEQIGSAQTLWLDGANLFPDLNLAYRVSSPGTYDAIGVRDYDALYRRVLRAPEVKLGNAVLGVLHQPVDPDGLGSLRTMGIRYLVTQRAYPLSENVGEVRFADVDPDGTARFRATFDSDDPGRVDVVTAWSPAMAGATRCRLALGRTEADLQVIGEAPCGPGGATFSLDGLVVDGVVTVAVTPIGADPGAAAGDPDAAEPRLSVLTTDVPGLELVDEAGFGFRLFRVPGSPERYFSPAATVAGDLDDGDVIDDPGAEPLELAAIDAPADRAVSEGDRPGGVEVLAETSTSVRLRVTRPTAGWLVALQTRYPGWTATVDGRSVDIATANGAFLGVPVPAGESEVVLRFRPASVRVGFAVTLVALVGLVACLVLAVRRRPTPSSPPGEASEASEPAG